MNYIIAIVYQVDIDSSVLTDNFANAERADTPAHTCMHRHARIQTHRHRHTHVYLKEENLIVKKLANGRVGRKNW